MLAAAVDQPSPMTWFCVMVVTILVGVLWLGVTEHFAEKDRRAWREQVRREMQEKADRLRRGQ